MWLGLEVPPVGVWRSDRHEVISFAARTLRVRERAEPLTKDPDVRAALGARDARAATPDPLRDARQDACDEEYATRGFEPLGVVHHLEDGFFAVLRRSTDPGTRREHDLRASQLVLDDSALGLTVPDREADADQLLVLLPLEFLLMEFLLLIEFVPVGGIC